MTWPAGLDRRATLVNSRSFLGKRILSHVELNIDTVGELMWQSYYIYYHDYRRRLVRLLVHPLVSSLIGSGDIDSFFFIYYPLGGPHIRLRLRVFQETIAKVDQIVSSAVSEFLARWPSERSLDPQAILRHNLKIIEGAPSEDDAEVYPDNSLRVTLYKPETERYGGSTLVTHSLDFFALSSAEVLLSIEKSGELSWGRQLTEAFRLLVRQAWGFARTPDEFFNLLNYKADPCRAEKELAIRQGDLEFASRPEIFVGLLRSELEVLTSRLPASDNPRATDPLTLMEGSLRLSKEIQAADEASRRRIGISQMHMTANRLALSLNEEIYLCRLMSQAARLLAREETVGWQKLTRTLGRNRSSSKGSLEDLLRSILAEFSVPPLTLCPHASRLADPDSQERSTLR